MAFAMGPNFLNIRNLYIPSASLVCQFRHMQSVLTQPPHSVIGAPFRKRHVSLFVEDPELGIPSPQTLKVKCCNHSSTELLL